MSDFTPALPKQMTWRVGKNKGADAEKKPNRMTFFIPAESMQGLIEHLMTMVDTATNQTEEEIYNFKTREKETVTGYYLTGKGIGDLEAGWAKGDFNLMKIEAVAAPPVAPPAPPVAPAAPPMPAVPASSGF